MDEYNQVLANADSMRASVDMVNRDIQRMRDLAAYHRVEAQKCDAIAEHLAHEVVEISRKEDADENPRKRT